MREMRLKKREITDPEILREILESCEVVRIGAMDEEGMFIVPMNYGYDVREEDGTLHVCLYLHGAKEGRKAAAFAADPRVAVEMDYFADALFIGDSRTDGLRLYSGIKGADFYCYKGLTVFEMDDRAVVELDGGKYTVEQALEKGPQYAKIYISLGINELGYFNDEAFHQTFGDFLKQVKASQPGAVVYLENLVPVNAEKCAANKQPYYVNNDRVAAYNAIFPQLAEEYQVVLLDVADALTDENGILPADATVDGVHFTKAWYQKWLAYLMEHTVDADCYAAGQTAAEGANET
jgi:hypothetical protein